MKHLLIIGHTPPTISPVYNHQIWYRLSILIQRHLLDHPSHIPVTSLTLGWETIAAEIAVRLNRPFICHSITSEHPPTDWCSADKMTYINALLEASQTISTPWPLKQTNAVLAFWNRKTRNRVGQTILNLQRASIPVTNCYIPPGEL